MAERKHALNIEQIIEQIIEMYIVYFQTRHL
jgi:hypothetical protein